MLQLNLTNEPEWLDLGHGVKILVRPLTTSLMVAAREDPAVTEIAEESSAEAIGIVFATSLARVAIIEWEGVGDADGNVLPVSEKAITALLAVFPIFEAFQEQFVQRGLLLESEKNASAPLPSGSSTGAMDTATPVRKPAKNARAG